MTEIQTGEILCDDYGLMPVMPARMESWNYGSASATARLCSKYDHSRVYVRLHMPTFIDSNTPP